MLNVIIQHSLVCMITCFTQVDNCSGHFSEKRGVFTRIQKLLKNLSSEENVFIIDTSLLPASSCCFCEQNYFPSFSAFFFCLLCAWGVKWTGRVLFCCDFISVIVYYGRLPNSLSPLDYVIFFSHLINFICRTAKHSVIDYVVYFQK